MIGKRPLSVTILGLVYIAVGAIGFTYHLREFRANGFRPDDLWVELVRILAIVAGVFMLRGHNWARWLALGWIGLHVVLSAFHTVGEFVAHCLFCAVIAWVLFRMGSAAYFRGSGVDS